MTKLIPAVICLFLAIPCQARIITVDDDGPADFNNIQAAIDVSNNSDIILVADGIYTGDGNRRIDFKGKVITLLSENGPDNCIIDCENNGRGFIFKTGEEHDSVLDGFTITHGLRYCPPEGCPFTSYGGGILCGGSPTIRNCLIYDNYASSGGGISINGNPKIINCIIIGNLAGIRGSGIYSAGNPTLINCTFSGNSDVMGSPIYFAYGNPILTNCILWDNAPEEIRVQSGTPIITYSDVQGGYEGEGNIDVDPNFVDLGYRDPNGTPEPWDDFWVNGDYHLKSQTGRWDPNSQSWVLDYVTSPCIDAGNPGCPVEDEPLPNGNRINMGAYGGTVESSKSPENWRSIADMTNDLMVDSKDLRVYVDYWLESGECIPSDFDRSQFVDFNDFALFGLHWSYPSALEPGISYQVEDCNMEGAVNQPSAENSNETRFSVRVEGSYIHFEDFITANCCLDEIELQMTVEEDLITIYEIEHLTTPCFCLCDYPTTAILGPFEPGTYTLEVYDITGILLGSTVITIGPAQ